MRRPSFIIQKIGGWNFAIYEKCTPARTVQYYDTLEITRKWFNN